MLLFQCALLVLPVIVTAAPTPVPVPGIVSDTLIKLVKSLGDPNVRDDIKTAAKNRILATFGNGVAYDKNVSANKNCPKLPKGSPLIFRNDLTASDAVCKPVTVIFARGTGNVGNVGDDVGPCFFKSLENIVGQGNVAVQGINNYQATITEYLKGGSVSGAQNIQTTLALAMQNCPKTSIVLSGFSQGAMIMHLAAKRFIPPAVMKSVAAVVLFGDPKNGTAMSGIDSRKVATFCNDGDAICAGSDIVLAPHHSYEANSDSAASIVARLLAEKNQDSKSGQTPEESNEKQNPGSQPPNSDQREPASGSSTTQEKNSPISTPLPPTTLETGTGDLSVVVNDRKPQNSEPPKVSVKALPARAAMRRVNQQINKKTAKDCS